LLLSIDAMGGDSGAAAVLAGCAIARRRHPDLRFLLHGDEAALQPLLKHRRVLAQSCEIRHVPGIIAMSEKPSQAVRRGRNTSMWHALEAVASGECRVAVSAGNTGALMAISMFRIGLIEGISRPAIAVLWPTKRGQSVVLDVGANAGCDAQQLVEFAVMGEAFARAIFGIERPTVGLLNIGEEEMKGIESVKRAGQILRASELPMEFCGFIEGNGIGEGAVDVPEQDRGHAWPSRRSASARTSRIRPRTSRRFHSWRNSLCSDAPRRKRGSSVARIASSRKRSCSTAESLSHRCKAITVA